MTGYVGAMIHAACVHCPRGCDIPCDRDCAADLKQYAADLQQCVGERARVYHEKYELLKAVRRVVGYGRALRYGRTREVIGENDDFFLALDNAEHMLWKYDITCERRDCRRPTLDDDERYCELHR